MEKRCLKAVLDESNKLVILANIVEEDGREKLKFLSKTFDYLSVKRCEKELNRKEIKDFLRSLFIAQKIKILYSNEELQFFIGDDLVSEIILHRNVMPYH